MTKRPIHEIARDIKSNWTNISPPALPFLRAMLTLEVINDNYGIESGETIVRYFLCNASTWKGEKARQVKEELRKMLDCVTIPNKKTKP